MKLTHESTGAELRDLAKFRLRQMEEGQAWIDAHPVYPTPTPAYDQLEAIIRRVPKSRRRRPICMEEYVGLRAALAALGRISK